MPYRRHNGSYHKLRRRFITRFENAMSLKSSFYWLFARFDIFHADDDIT